MKKLSPQFNAATVAPREVFQIVLPAMPSAGYAWSLNIQGEGTLLSEQSRHPAGNAIGGQVSKIFSIVADRPGQITVEAIYKRPWLTTAEKTETFTITVK
jgi:predicted secreted protein